MQFASSPGSFAVVSAASGRQVGHIHGILSNATTQHQTVPVRFNSLADGQSQQTHQIIAMSNSSGVSEQHMIIPMNSSAQVATSPMPSILRKREPEGQPIKLTKKIGNITSVNISNRLRAQVNSFYLTKQIFIRKHY